MDFKYIRNFLPNRPYLQPCRYKDAKSILIALRKWNNEGKLNSPQKLIFRETRPPEELYDLENDPHEINNLAGDSKYADKLQTMRTRLNDWMEETDDQGREPESAEMYDSDMSVYRTTLKRKGELEQLKILETNVDLMKKWAADGN
ncbi:MAG: DUF4976 domain-containing protein [Rubripirellula sp.]|nr:DUF4976 domain-containing protein [Rubripirellula sp.]